MMRTFRKLTNSIVFKIFLGFVALSFVMFGVSDFLLGGSSWIAKVDGKKISYSKFQRYLQHEQESIQQSPYGQNPEVAKYLTSPAFKQNVLNKMVSEVMLQKIQEDFGVAIGKETTLRIIADDANFQDANGKFSSDIFNRFLAKNNISEEQYLAAIQNEITLKTILQSLAVKPIVNEEILTELNNYSKEERKIDLIKISTKSLSDPANPSEEELQKFFAQNKDKFVVPENREVSYISFSANELRSKTEVTDAEIKAEYDNNKEKFQKAESRNFYHVLFDDEKKANEFLASVKKQKKDAKFAQNFLELAKKATKKKSDEIVLQNAAKADLLPEIANKSFALKEGEFSEILKSPLGFHVFFVKQINPPKQIAFAEVKSKIKAELTKAKDENILRDTMSKIEDELLTSNSLAKVTEKFKLKVNTVKFDKNGNDLNGQEIKQIKAFDNFVANSFSLGEKQTSKVYYSESNKAFYALFVEKINREKQQDLEDVQNKAIALFKKERKKKELQELTIQVYDNISKNAGNPKFIKVLAKKYNLKIEENKKIARFEMVDYQGQKVPYSSDLAKAVFAAKVDEAINPQKISDDEFAIAIVKKVEKYSSSKEEIAGLTEKFATSSGQELLKQYDQYLQTKYPVEVNKKLLGTNDSET